MARLIPRAAVGPWTRTSHTRRWNPKRLRTSSSWKSCHAAVSTLLTTPTCSGIGDATGALVGVEQALGDQPADDLVALGGEIAEREARVEVGHLQPELAGGRVEVEVAEHAHLHPVGESQAVLLQHRPQLHPGVGEELHVEHGLHAGRVVGQAEVGVLAALTPALDLATHPDAVAEAASQRRVERVGQLGDRVRRVGRIVERLVAEVERWLAHVPILPGACDDAVARQAPRTCRLSGSSPRSSHSSSGSSPISANSWPSIGRLRSRRTASSCWSGFSS